MANLQATGTRLGVAPTKGAAQSPVAAPSAGSQVAKALSQVFNTPGDVRQQLEKVVAQGGSAAAAQARTLLQQLDANPNLANDPGFKQAVGTVWQQASIANAPGLIQNSGLGSTVNANATKAVQGVVSTQKQAAAQAQQDNLSQQILDTAKGQAADNKSYFDTHVTPQLGAQQLAAQGASAMDLSALSQQTQARDRANAAQQALVAQQGQNAAKYNAQGTQLYNDYSGQQNALNTQDQGTLSTYLNATNPLMTQLQSHGSNPADVAAQQAALQRAIGIAGGSLDYNAAQANYQGYSAAQASTDPNDLQRQIEGYNSLQGIGGGRLDYQSQAAQAFANEQDVANQHKALNDIQADVENGGRQQQEALDLIKSRTGVEPTGQEALLYELNRRSRESQDASSRGAVMDRLAARGLRSGGAELASMQQAGQQTAQDRLLADMAANAGAVQRAKDYTGMQSQLATALRSSNQNALGLQGNMSSALRNASFDEAYKRGVGADTASANNQGTRLQGSLGAANTANVMRGQGDTMSMFNTGQTNNASQFNANAYNQNSMFNAGQQNNAYANNQSTRLGGAGMQATQSNAIRSANDTMSMFQDNFASQEANRVGGLAGQTANIGLGTTNQIGTRNQNTYNGGVDLNNTNYGRDKDTTGLAWDTASSDYGRDTDIANATSKVGQNNFNNATTLVNSGSGAASSRAGVMAPGNQSLLDALKFGVGKTVNDQDLIALGGY